MYCVNCGNKLNSKDKYCSACGKKVESIDKEVENNDKKYSDTNDIKENNNKTDILPLLLGISSIFTIFFVPLSVSLAIASIILGNKNNRENPENISKAPIILGTISLVLSTIIVIIYILLSLFLLRNSDKIEDYLHRNWNNIIEEIPNNNESNVDQGLPF